MKGLFNLVFCFNLITNICAQQNPVRFQHLTASNGLSQGHVLCMIQDKSGYIWAGTYNGLNRYNGYNFDTFYSIPGDTNSLAINVVFSLFEDRSGKIWCGTWGIDVYDPEKESFIKHIPAETGPGSISRGEVTSIEQDNDGNMWFGTREGGLNKYNTVTGRITWFREDLKNKNALHSDHVNDILMDRKGFLWIATEGGGVSKMRTEDEQITNYQHNCEDSKILPSRKTSCLFEDRDGIIWFGDNNGTLTSYSYVTKLFSRYYPCQENGIVNKVRIMQISQSRDGRLLLSTNGMGYIEYDPKQDKSVVFLHKTSDDESILSNENWSVLVTASNTIFVGSYGRGISVYSPYNNKFEVFTIPEPESRGEINAFTDAIEDNLGHLVTGTYYGFLVFDEKTWQYKHYLPGKTYEENKILTICLAPDGTIWLSSPACVHRYDKNFNKIASYIFDPGLKDHSVYAITFDYRNNLWIGLMTKGLLKIDEKEWRNLEKTNLEYRFYPKNDLDSLSISSNQHWIVYNDTDSNLWIGGIGGLDRYNYESDNFTRVVYPGTVKTIDRDQEGKLWLGTIGNGLYCFDPVTTSMLKFTTENGLAHSFINGLLTDKNNNVWITSEGGLSRLISGSDEIRIYDKRDGLPDNHFEDKSESKLRDGRFYLGTKNGFVIFQPESITDDSGKVSIVLTELLIDNEKVTHFKEKNAENIQEVPVSRLTNISLQPNQRDIEFHFAALQFASPHKIKYSYILKGYDKEWINTDASKRLAKYTNLGGGKYIFIVKATNSEGKWTSKPLEITLEVHPPLHKTIVFKLLIILILLGLIFFYFRSRLVQEKKQNILLLEKVKERTLEISEKNKQLQLIAENLKESNSLLKENQAYIEKQSLELKKQRDELSVSNATKDKLFSVIAHDLKAPFNVILGFTELMIERFNEWNKEKQLKILYLLKESSEGAYTLLENLLQWSVSKSGTMAFDPQSKPVNEIITTTYKEIQVYAKRKGIELINLTENDLTLIKVDVNMFNTILRNLIMNAIKYSKRGGKVILEAKQKDQNFVMICVRDEGMGMSQEYAQKLFNPETSKSVPGTEGEKGTGIGLILCKDFIEYHKGSIWVESEVNKGTIVCFTIPVA